KKLFHNTIPKSFSCGCFSSKSFQGLLEKPHVSTPRVARRHDLRILGATLRDIMPIFWVEYCRDVSASFQRAFIINKRSSIFLHREGLYHAIPNFREHDKIFLPK